MRVSVYQRSVRAVVVVRLSVDNDETKKRERERVLKGERRFEFVGNDGDEGRLRRGHVALPYLSRHGYCGAAGNLNLGLCGPRTQGVDSRRFATAT